jgi:hypothetical protein
MANLDWFYTAIIEAAHQGRVESLILEQEDGYPLEVRVIVDGADDGLKFVTFDGAPISANLEQVRRVTIRDRDGKETAIPGPPPDVE